MTKESIQRSLKDAYKIKEQILSEPSQICVFFADSSNYNLGQNISIKVINIYIEHLKNELNKL